MSKAAGKCVFCGGAGLSKGHIWPDWIDKVLPRTATHHEQEIGRFNTFEPSVPGPEYSRRMAQGHARTRKPRNTCRHCNGGWMSVMEGRARRCGTDLMTGRPQLLDLHDQDAIANLLTLISMRVEFLGDMRAISSEEHHLFRHRREPSDHWKIWIAEFMGNDSDEHWSRTYAAQMESKPTDKVGPEYCNVRVTTLVMGKLCAHLFYSPIIDFAGYDGVELTQIWPRRNSYIDTSHLPLRTGNEILYLHEAFARESLPMPSA